MANIAGEQPQEITYFLLSENVLEIVRSEKDSDDKTASTTEELYRHELWTDYYAILYDLEGLSREPDDNTLQIEMEKI